MTKYRFGDLLQKYRQTHGSEDTFLLDSMEDWTVEITCEKTGEQRTFCMNFEPPESSSGSDGLQRAK